MSHYFETLWPGLALCFLALGLFSFGVSAGSSLHTDRCKTGGVIIIDDQPWRCERLKP